MRLAEIHTGGLSREGIPWREYELGPALAAAPIGFALVAPLMAMGPLVTERVEYDPEAIPSNAILYMLHVESFLMLFTPRYWDLFEELRKLKNGSIASTIRRILSIFDKMTPEREEEADHRRGSFRRSSGDPSQKGQSSRTIMGMGNESEIRRN